MDDPHANGLTSFPHNNLPPGAPDQPSSTNGAAQHNPVVAIPTELGHHEPGPAHKKRRGRPARNQDDGASGEGPPKSVRRGRPPGSRNKVSRATAGIHPHVLMVNSGEDIVDRLRSFSTTYKRSLCVLAASGSLSSATLMQVGQGGQGVGVTLTGQFTVLSISGAVLHEHGDPSSGDPKVFLSASLANPTGGVVGGTVAGPMDAHGSAMVVVGHWAPPDNSRSLSLSNGANEATSPHAIPADPRFSGGALTPSKPASVPVLSHSVLSPPTTIPAFSLPQPTFPHTPADIQAAPLPPPDVPTGPPQGPVPSVSSTVGTAPPLSMASTHTQVSHGIPMDDACMPPSLNGGIKLEMQMDGTQNLQMGPQ